MALLHAGTNEINKQTNSSAKNRTEATYRVPNNFGTSQHQKGLSLHYSCEIQAVLCGSLYLGIVKMLLTFCEPHSSNKNQ
jgi:hypothetical protein